MQLDYVKKGKREMMNTCKMMNVLSRGRQGVEIMGKIWQFFQQLGLLFCGVSSQVLNSLFKMTKEIIKVDHARVNNKNVSWIKDY